MPVNHPTTWRILGTLALAWLGATSSVAAARSPTHSGTGRNLLFSPYKYVPRNVDPASHVLRIAATGSPIPLVGKDSLLADHLPNLRAITLAFATGECGSEDWGGVPTASITGTAVPALSRAGVDYVISTGGQGKKFTCATPAAFVGFVRRYLSPHLLGVDFDIEYTQTPAEIKALVADAAHAEKLFPNLRFSFTLATWAGSDGKHAGLNPLGDAVLKAIKASSLSHYTINLMVMDYGKTDPSVCVVAHAACDMGRSAIQAVQNLRHTWGIPAGKIALTALIGVNDTPGEVFTLADLDAMIRYAVANGLAGVHFWSLDRDTPCPSHNHAASQEPVCNGTGDPPLAYTRRALHDLGAPPSGPGSGRPSLQRP